MPFIFDFYAAYVISFRRAAIFTPHYAALLCLASLLFSPLFSFMPPYAAMPLLRFDTAAAVYAAMPYGY